MFLHSGTTYGAALYYLAETEDEKGIKNIFFEMARRSDEGAPLYEVVSQSGIFPDDVASMLKMAERTGKTEETLGALASYYDRLDSRDYALRTSLMYPSVLLLVMSLVVVLLLVYVMPIFSNVYASFGVSLSGFAAVLLSIGEFLSRIFPIVCALFLLFALFLIIFSTSETLRERIFGLNGKSKNKLAKKINAARFATALTMALSVGMTLEEATALSGELVYGENDEKTDKCINELGRVNGTTEAAYTSSGLLPAPEARLLALGIKGGNIESASEEIARRLERDASDASDEALGRIEPIMVISASVVIGIILLSVMIPLAGIMASIG